MLIRAMGPPQDLLRRPKFDAGVSLEVAAASPPVRARSSGGHRFSLLWWVFVVNGAVLVTAALSCSRLLRSRSAIRSLSWPARHPSGRPCGDAGVEPRAASRRAFPLLQAHRGYERRRPRECRVVGCPALNPRSSEGAALVSAFNGMLDRLESARREAGTYGARRTGGREAASSAGAP